MRQLFTACVLIAFTLGCAEHAEHHGEKIPSKPMPMSGQLKPLGDSLGVPPYSLGHVHPRGPGLYFQPGVAQPGVLGPIDEEPR